jgi:hypothetical protein
MLVIALHPTLKIFNTFKLSEINNHYPLYLANVIPDDLNPQACSLLKSVTVAIGLRLTLSANVIGNPFNDSVNAFLISSIIFEVRRNNTKLTGHNE